MKLSILTFAASFICAIAAGQNKFTAFQEGKKSIELSTGICMRYIDTGNANGLPVVFLHGYSDTSRSFQSVIEDLKEINGEIRIIAPDLRGHGNTSMPDESACKNAPESCFTINQFAADVINLMDQLCIEKFHVVGHSMGSVIAQNLVLNYTDRVTSMVLLATFVNGKECSAINEFLIEELIEKDWKCMLEEKLAVNWPSDVYNLKPANMGENVVNYLRENWVVEPGAMKEFLESVFPETLNIPLGTWIGAIKALSEIDYREALKNLNIPTLILWGSEDNVTNPKDQVQVKSTFRSASRSGAKVFYKTYEGFHLRDSSHTAVGLGHNFHWAAHRMVAGDIDLFIRKEQVTDAETVDVPGVVNAVAPHAVSSVLELK